MQRCLQLASNGLQRAIPNPMVGAVIVCDGQIIGEGYHVCCGQAHAEVNAVKSLRRTACRELGASADELSIQQWVFDRCSRSTIYVSLEPCSHFGKTPPCANLLAALRFKRCVIGTVDPFARVQGRGIQKLKEAGIEVTVGVLEQACRQLNKRFFTTHGKQRPYVLLKWAQTPDGYLDRLREDDSRPALAISSSLTAMRIHKLRSEYQAILVGKRTDRLDHPSLTVRHWVGPNPLRLVIDRPLPELLSHLHQQGVQSLMVEGGACLLHSFLKAGLWDEIQVEVGSAPLHESGVPAPQLPQGFTRVEEQLLGHTFVHIYQEV